MKPAIDKPAGDIPFELGIEDLSVGDGDEATPGGKVTVHYVGVAFRERRGVRRLVGPRAPVDLLSVG